MSGHSPHPPSIRPLCMANLMYFIVSWALLMATIGFLCVSFARAALTWVSQVLLHCSVWLQQAVATACLRLVETLGGVCKFVTVHWHHLPAFRMDRDNLWTTDKLTAIALTFPHNSYVLWIKHFTLMIQQRDQDQKTAVSKAMKWQLSTGWN
jgi:hypothetical protein